MDCGTSMVKYILFLFNTLCSICAILVLVFGVILLNDAGRYPTMKEAAETHQIPIALIILGSVILIISFFGCCGAIRESYCMSMTYSVFMLILLIVQLICLVVFWISKDDILKLMGEIVDEAWEERTKENSFMDALQMGLKCCGVNGPQDYVTNIALPPKSCCPNNECSMLNMYTSGCKSKMMDFWAGKNDIIKYSGLGIALIELVSFIFACTLANNIRNYKRRAAY